MAGGIPLTWWEGCISFSVDARGIPRLEVDYAAAEQMAIRSFERWSSATCGTGQLPGIVLQSFGPHSCWNPEYNQEGPNANAVTFYGTDWPHGVSALGLTTVSFDVKTGRIFDADIEINAAGVWNTDQLEYVLSHEVGHFLGLAHTPEEDSLMSATYSPLSATGLPELAPYDVSSICAVYPPVRIATSCDFNPSRGYAADCGGDVVGTGCSFARVQTRTSGLEWWLAGALIAMTLARKAGTSA